MYENNFTVKLNSEIIQCKTFTLDDYIKFLFARSSEDSKLIKLWMNNILKSHTSMQNLPKHESEFVIVNLLAKSLNDGDIYQEYVCECAHEFPVKIDLSKMYINYNDVDIKELYTIGGFKLLLNWPSLFEDDNVPQMIVKAIDSIFVGDERISIDDLSEVELDELYSSITPDDMTKIKNKLLAPFLQMAVPVLCPKCGKKHVHVISKFKEFIRIL